MCVKLVTNLSADLLLDYMLEIENMYGRMRHIRWGPRTIDIDLLLFGDEIRQDVHLQLPHPRMLERGFVLHPLAHIIESNEPMYTSVHEHLKKLDGKDGIKRWKMPAWHKEFVPFAN